MRVEDFHLQVVQHARHTKTRRGKVGTATFPPRLEIPQKRRDSHFPTARATAAHPLPLKLNGQTSYDHPCEFWGQVTVQRNRHSYSVILDFNLPISHAFVDFTDSSWWFLWPTGVF